ncbi:MAG: T9SS type A sorting domain-containing protein [Schleiferiaceae bacterium]|nr:T9SS type A sorting domain-containing protein [Schleiferiaceae bacterium]
MKHLTLTLFLMCSFVAQSQLGVMVTDMPSAFCQSGQAEISSEYYFPLTLQNTDNKDFYTLIEVYDNQGLHIDSIEIISPVYSYYSAQALYQKGDSLIVAGTKGTCSSPNNFFLGHYDLSGKSYQELKSIPVINTNDVVMGLFNAGNHRQGFYTQSDVFIYDYSLDSTFHIVKNVGNIASVQTVNNDIIVASGSGLFAFKNFDIQQPDTLLNESVRLLSIDQSENQIYAASNFFVIRYNKSLSIQDSLDLISGPFNIGAPNLMDASDARLYLLDGNKVFTLDSNFSFVANYFTIGLRTSDTQLKNFKIQDNRVVTFGVKGHYYGVKMSHPWFLGIYPLNNSLPTNFNLQLTQCSIDSLVKFKSNGEDYIRAKFNFFINNKSSALHLEKFVAGFYLNGTMCESPMNQEWFYSVGQAPSSVINYKTGWLEFGPIQNIEQYHSANMRFTAKASAFNNTDYGSTIQLDVATNSFGFISINEDALSQLKCAPNPASSQIKLIGLQSSVKISVINHLGQEVINTSASEEHNTINISSIKPGVYMLFVTDEYQNHHVEQILKL